MDLSEPLNKAHTSERRAEKALRIGNIPEAIKNYSIAAENFDLVKSEFQFTKNSSSPLPNSDLYALESLKNQHIFCLRQIQLLTSKLDQIHKQYQIVMAKKDGEYFLSNLDYDKNSLLMKNFDSNELRQLVLEKINEQDSLLELLENSGGAKKDDENVRKNSQISTGQNENSSAMGASKCPKTDKTVIEELKQCNDALRNFIVILLKELESKSAEIEKLKSELDRAKSPSYRQRSSTTPSKNRQERKRAESESIGKILELPPLDFASIKSWADHESL